MDSWLILLIAILATLAVFLLLGLLSYRLMRLAEPKFMAELRKLDGYETARGEKLLAVLDRLIARGYSFDIKTYGLIKDGVGGISALSPSDRAKYKDICDFTGLFLAKVGREDKRYGRYITPAEADSLRGFYDDSTLAYKAYNRKAARYNILLGMVFTKAIMAIRRERRQPAVLF